LGGNHGYGAGRLSVGSVAIASGTCLLLPGDNIIPQQLDNAPEGNLGFKAGVRILLQRNY